MTDSPGRPGRSDRLGRPGIARRPRRPDTRPLASMTRAPRFAATVRAPGTGSQWHTAGQVLTATVTPMCGVIPMDTPTAARTATAQELGLVRRSDSGQTATSAPSPLARSQTAASCRAATTRAMVTVPRPAVRCPVDTGVQQATAGSQTTARHRATAGRTDTVLAAARQTATGRRAPEAGSMDVANIVRTGRVQRDRRGQGRGLRRTADEAARPRAARCRAALHRAARCRAAVQGGPVHGGPVQGVHGAPAGPAPTARSGQLPRRQPGVSGPGFSSRAGRRPAVGQPGGLPRRDDPRQQWPATPEELGDRGRGPAEEYGPSRPVPPEYRAPAGYGHQYGYQGDQPGWPGEQHARQAGFQPRSDRHGQRRGAWPEEPGPFAGPEDYPQDAWLPAGSGHQPGPADPRWRGQPDGAWPGQGDGYRRPAPHEMGGPGRRSIQAGPWSAARRLRPGRARPLRRRRR